MNLYQYLTFTFRAQLQRRLDDSAGSFRLVYILVKIFAFHCTYVFLLKGRHYAHKSVIERHRDILLRCTDINIDVIMHLRRPTVDVIDFKMECTLVNETNDCVKNATIYDYLAKCSKNKFDEFVSVMRVTKQNHVANLLTGNTEGN